MMSGDGGGDVAVIDVQEMTKQTQKQTQKVRPNPSVHYRLLPPLPLLPNPSDPYRYHLRLQFLYQLGMYRMVIQGVAPGDGVIDECKL
jgi:hypothetical protein